VDVLVEQFSGKFLKSEHSPKSSQRFDRPARYSKGKQENNPMEKSFTKVICSACKKECEIPFKPRGDKPVYCRECFAIHKNGGLVNDKPSNKSIKGRSVQRSYFDKQQGGKFSRRGKKKKPIS
jgi:CxxC-x17-CxxC domain-containing protein